ncbi:hypothetical protein [Longimicrobium sp.]|uniref:hypothetical protein n=1 Tax=Longimicrobium sp. TaxID=2029185 RepID=UPI003B3A6647
MISPLRHTHSLLAVVLFSLILAPVSAAAQLTFGGIPWGTPVDSATAAIQRAGYVPRGQDQNGDWLFLGPDSADVVAMFDSAGLVGVGLDWFKAPDSLPGLYTRVADAMAADLGPPADRLSDVAERISNWYLDGVNVMLYLRPRGDGLDSLLVAHYGGPGWDAEFERRLAAQQARLDHEYAEGPTDSILMGAWLTLHNDNTARIQVDTAAYVVLGDSLFGVRLLYHWAQPRRLENGMIYDGAHVQMELECGAREAMLVHTVPVYGYQTLTPRDGPWWLPPLPGTYHPHVVAAACDALARQPR